MSFGVLTLNLWNNNEPLVERYRALEVGLKNLHPDIICLQEVSADPKSGCSQAEIIAEMCKLPYGVNEHGLAIICSSPVIRSNCIALPECSEDQDRHVLLADFAIEGRPLLVANAHLAASPRMIEGRRNQANVALAAIKSHRSSAGTAEILCGDFNDVPGSPAVRAVLQSDQGFHDVFSDCHPDDPGYTYTTQNKYVDPSWTMDERIDFIFANRDLAPKACFVVFDGGNNFDLVSDHFGVFCNFVFR